MNDSLSQQQADVGGAQSSQKSQGFPIWEPFGASLEVLSAALSFGRGALPQAAESRRGPCSGGQRQHPEGGRLHATLCASLHPAFPRPPPLPPWSLALPSSQTSVHGIARAGQILPA